MFRKKDYFQSSCLQLFKNKIKKKVKKSDSKSLNNGINVVVLHPQWRIGSYLNIENRIKNKAKVLEKRFVRNKRSSYICRPYGEASS